MAHRMTAAEAAHSTGYIVLDLVKHNDRVAPHVGGSAANVAINLSLLGWSVSVSGLLGDDAAGRLVTSQLQHYGVDTAQLILDTDARTPVLIHEISGSGHRFRFSCPNCGTKYAKFRPLPGVEADQQSVADLHYFDRASAYALALARHAHASEAAVVFEPNTPGRPSISAALGSEADLFRVSNEIEIALPPGAKIIGMGAEGATVDADVKRMTVPSLAQIPIVDGAGAGDWLTAGIISALGSGGVKRAAFDELADAVQQSQTLAAKACAVGGTRGFVFGPVGKMRVGPFELRTVPNPSQAIAPTSDCEAWYCNSNTKD